MKNCLVFFLIMISLCSYSQEPLNYRVNKKSIPIIESCNGPVLIKVPKNKILTLLSFNDSCDCFHVKYKNYIGIVSSALWLDDAYQEGDTIYGNREELLATVEERLSIAKASANLKRKSALIKKYGYTEGIQVLEGKIWIGMTVDMTLDSWGIPFKVIRSSSDWGPREQWIYSDAYLYFENGILAEILTIKRNNTAHRESP